MGKLKIGIVEDEVIIADNICRILHDLGYIVTDPAISYTEAIEMIEQRKPDLVLLDVQLSGKKDGIDVANVIREMYDIPFVFLTANSDTATLERAKKVRPSAYLLKPFTKEDLFTSIEMAINNYSFQHKDTGVKKTKSEFIFIKEGNYFHKVAISEILYLESDHVYVTIYLTSGKKILIRASLQDYILNFDPSEIVRVHRSYAVNMQHIDGIDQIHISVKGNKVPISKTYRDELLNKLNLGN